MALRKSITTNQSVVAEYWSIPSVNFYKDRKHVVATFHLYVNKAAYDAGARPVLRDAAKLELQGSAFEAYFGTVNPDAALLQKQAYTAAKTLGVICDYGEPVKVADKYNGLRALFSDAEDV